MEQTTIFFIEREFFELRVGSIFAIIDRFLNETVVIRMLALKIEDDDRPYNVNRFKYVEALSDTGEIVTRNIIQVSYAGLDPAHPYVTAVLL